MQSRSRLFLTCHRSLLAALFLFAFAASAGETDCITQAAACLRVNDLLIKAVIWKESSYQPHLVHHNMNNSIDVGMMQINSVNFDTLSRLGIGATKLQQNSCANIYAGTWLLSLAIKRHGYTWDGISYYHSANPVLRQRYAKSLISIILHNSQTISAISVPADPGMQQLFHCDPS